MDSFRYTENTLKPESGQIKPQKRSFVNAHRRLVKRHPASHPPQPAKSPAIRSNQIYKGAIKSMNFKKQTE